MSVIEEHYFKYYSSLSVKSTVSFKVQALLQFEGHMEINRVCAHQGLRSR